MAEIESFTIHSEGADLLGAAPEEAICLFAFAECADALEGSPLDEASGQRPMLHHVGAVTAVIDLVPIADYCGADAERRLADVDWLAPRVRRHAQFVEWAMRRSPVFPAPFGTLYSSLASLTAFMHAHQATISNFLRAVTGKEEWELRAAAEFDDPEILDQLALSAWPDWRELSKGARYMRLCRDRDALLEYGRAAAASLVHDFVGELRPLTAGVRQHDILAPPSSRGTALVARYAFLVAKTQIADVRGRMEEIAIRASRRHVTIALLGPWPPFSFRPNLDASRQ